MNRDGFTHMSVLDTAKEIVRIGSTAGLSKDVIDLLEKKVTLLVDENFELSTKVSRLEIENAQLRTQLQHLQPASARNEGFAILKVLESEQKKWKVEEIAARLGISEIGHVHALLTRLRVEESILEFPAGFEIAAHGRLRLHGV